MHGKARLATTLVYSTLFALIGSTIGCDSVMIQEWLYREWTRHQYDRHLADFSYSVGDDGVTFRFRDTLNRGADDWGVGLLYERVLSYEFDFLSTAPAELVDDEGNYEAFFSWELLGQEPGGPPYDANIWRVVQLPDRERGGVELRSAGRILEAGWLPDVVNQNLTDFACAVADNGVALRFRDASHNVVALGFRYASHAAWEYWIRLRDEQGETLATLRAREADDEGNYEVSLVSGTVNNGQTWRDDAGERVPPDMPAQAVDWVVVCRWWYDGPMRIVSEPQPGEAECFDALYPALTDFSYRVANDAIYFSFCDANFATAGERAFEVWLVHENEGDSLSWMGALPAALVDENGGYEAVLEVDPTRLAYRDAWCVVQDFGREGPPAQYELQPLDLGPRAP